MEGSGIVTVPGGRTGAALIEPISAEATAVAAVTDAEVVLAFKPLEVEKVAGLFCVRSVEAELKNSGVGASGDAGSPREYISRRRLAASSSTCGALAAAAVAMVIAILAAKAVFGGVDAAPVPGGLQVARPAAVVVATDAGCDVVFCDVVFVAAPAAGVLLASACCWRALGRGLVTGVDLVAGDGAPAQREDRVGSLGGGSAAPDGVAKTPPPAVKAVLACGVASLERNLLAERK